MGEHVDRCRGKHSFCRCAPQQALDQPEPVPRLDAAPFLSSQDCGRIGEPQPHDVGPFADVENAARPKAIADTESRGCGDGGLDLVVAASLQVLEHRLGVGGGAAVWLRRPSGVAHKC